MRILTLPCPRHGVNYPDGSTIAPAGAERAALLKAAGSPPTPGSCLAPFLAASDEMYGTVVFRSDLPSCARWGSNGVSVFRRAASGRWLVVFAGSAYRCPVAHVPRSVQRDLGVCPLGTPPP